MIKSTLSSVLKTFGYIVFIIGIIAGFLVLQKLSAGGMFSKSEITPIMVVISILVAFYHGIFGVLCLGMSTLLDRSNNGKNTFQSDESFEVGSFNGKKCYKCGKVYASDFVGEFCEECGTHL